MAIKVVVHVENAADWLVANAAARFRLDRDTTAAFAAPTEVVTTVLVSGTDRYEAWDAGGVTTSWYRFRIEDANDVAISAWSTPWQVLASQPIATLASVKLRLGSGATATDDDVLQAIIDGVNSSIIARIGYWPGPSTDTTRVFHGKDAIGPRLWTPGGVRVLTSFTVGASTGAAQTAATVTDVITGPESYLLRPGEPYHYIEWKDVCAGAWSSWPVAYSNVTITGLFGWGQVPDDLVHVATAMAVRRWKSRNSGDADQLGSDEFGSLIISDRMPAEWRRVIDSYKLTGWAS